MATRWSYGAPPAHFDQLNAMHFLPEVTSSPSLLRLLLGRKERTQLFLGTQIEPKPPTSYTAYFAYAKKKLAERQVKRAQHSLAPLALCVDTIFFKVIAVQCPQLSVALVCALLLLLPFSGAQMLSQCLSLSRSAAVCPSLAQNVKCERYFRFIVFVAPIPASSNIGFVLC